MGVDVYSKGNGELLQGFEYSSYKWLLSLLCFYKLNSGFCVQNTPWRAQKARCFCYVPLCNTSHWSLVAGTPRFQACSHESVDFVWTEYGWDDSSQLQMTFAGVGKSEMVFLRTSLVPQLAWLCELRLVDWNASAGGFVWGLDTCSQPKSSVSSIGLESLCLFIWFLYLSSPVR